MEQQKLCEDVDCLYDQLGWSNMCGHMLFVCAALRTIMRVASLTNKLTKWTQFNKC